MTHLVVAVLVMISAITASAEYEPAVELPVEYAKRVLLNHINDEDLVIEGKVRLFDERFGMWEMSVVDSSITHRGDLTKKEFHTLHHGRRALLLNGEKKIFEMPLGRSEVEHLWDSLPGHIKEDLLVSVLTRVALIIVLITVLARRSAPQAEERKS